ncbi:BTAD domain-containing putative transcriptional regulator [Actinoplanes sp. N902-109]|uniref:AfsR/SARP family transcriptional regulator n=1 Tax=Actinoplanes sp. (strain N902-109) TaxID=649831 RepID=UPI0003295099|nr:BTAD domain-containing putative transcriptional regulator [Actinoplanes sp. N902-109]AGL16645.1 putative transcriptional activator, SARP family [Actinoplanes sp. N902-109]
MDVRILGSLEVVSGGVLITPSAPKLRQVLALLSTCANRVVRVDQLMEELWEDRPPLSATTTLQTYIYQLRKILHRADLRADQREPAAPAPAPVREDRDDGPLHTWPRGYLLSLAPAQLDVTQFEELARRGRGELYRDHVERAADTFRAALRLWRAPVLTDIEPGPLLRAEIVRLTELYRSVLEWRIDADLRLGRHHELVGELTAVVAEHPMHEGLQGKLMLALHRAGRRSDALVVYQQVRKVLNNELGLEPSPDLQRLHNGILAADPSVDPPPVNEQMMVRVARAKPIAQLPPDIPEIVGRDPEMAAVREALTVLPRSAPPVVVVTGAPGHGKSAFCIHAAHEVRAAFPDGQFYAELTDPDHGPVDPFAVLGDFLRSISVMDDTIPDTLEERRTLFRSWTADRKVLVVLDDVTSFAQVSPLLPSGPDCATLAAARRRLANPAITTNVDMNALDEAAALAMVTALLGKYPVKSDPEAARRLIDLCQGIPLVLGVATGRLMLRPHWPIRRLMDRLRRDSELLLELISGELSLQGSVEASYRLLPAPSRTAFGQLVRMPARPISVTRAAQLFQVGELTAETVLEQLVEFRLADPDPSGPAGTGQFQYQVSPLIRLAARQVVDQIQADEAGHGFGPAVTPERNGAGHVRI